ncbi:hypothetical protein [Neisseria sp.]|uniref:hypothetical protein n=1 Tax=Neisseria sp. TaxID=192066 RepID=UPI00359F1D3B
MIFISAGLEKDTGFQTWIPAHAGMTEIGGAVLPIANQYNIHTHSFIFKKRRRISDTDFRLNGNDEKSGIGAISERSPNGGSRIRGLNDRPSENFGCG